MAPVPLRLIFLAVTVSIVATTSDQSYFNHFIQKYGRKYRAGTSEYEQRFIAFQQSLSRIRTRTSRVNSDDAFYGITEFSDMMPDEFRHLLLKSDSETLAPTVTNRLLTGSGEGQARKLPVRVDWREKGIISGVRNQGKCGACWAYSTVQTIESMNALALGTPVWPLSVQQVIDCASSVSSANRGCDGGDTCAALSWMQSSQVALVSEAEYPMRDSSGRCVQSSSSQGVRVANFTCEDLTGNEEKILWKLANEGPLTAAVDATSWQDYLGGIIQFHCETNRNHAVQIVGYDMTGETGFYIVKNTWGTDFGINGYLQVAIGKNLCGIAEEVSSVRIINETG